MDAALEMGKAASDDARDIPSAAAASSASAGTERDVCAEVAPPPEAETNRRNGRSTNRAGTGTSRAPSEKDKKKGTRGGKGDDEKDLLDIPPGSEPLPEDGLGFVDAIHEHVDLYLASLPSPLIPAYGSWGGPRRPFSRRYRLGDILKARSAWWSP